MSTYKGFRTSTKINCTNEQVQEWFNNPITKELMQQCENYNAQKDGLNLGDSAPAIHIIVLNESNKPPVLHFGVI